LIESSCDKRFLHTVVASDYKNLYQPTNHGDDLSEKLHSNQIVTKIKSFKQELLLNDNNNNNAGTMTMTTTIVNTGNLADKGDVSSWPLMDTTLDKKIHYVWPQKGGILDEATIGNAIIVDGIDCGKMASLEGDMQVLVGAKWSL
jgi:hypothetical protein